MPVAIFADRGGYRLHAGDVFRTSAAYDSPQHNSIPDGAMGIVVGYFLPDQDSALSGLARKAGAGSSAAQDAKARSKTSH